jgi:ribose transport system permease protein
VKTNLFRRIVNRSESGIVLAAVILFIIFSRASDSFLSAYNIFNISRTLALYMFIALSQAIVVVVGGMNLSVGAIGGLTTITTGYLLSELGLPGWLAVLAALLVGLAAGTVNGLIITKFKINSFIVTLSTSFIYTGLVFGISKGYPYTHIPQSFSYMGRAGWFGMPLLFWLMAVALIMLYYMFKYTLVGRRLLTTGGNIEAARLSGINTDRIIIFANILSGFFAAIAGILWVSRMGSAQPATGQNWLIISFAIAIIGGTGLNGGSISALGLFMGGIILVLIRNGLIMMEANIYYEQAFFGSIILLAVALDKIREIYNKGLKNTVVMIKE